MRLVLQCAMCGTHHPVGTAVCSTCRASGVTQLRLMFECPTCGQLGLNPTCDACRSSPVAFQLPEPIELDDELIVAEEVGDEPYSLVDAEELEDEEPGDEEVGEEEFLLDDDADDDEADEKVVVDLTENDGGEEDAEDGFLLDDEDDPGWDDDEFEDVGLEDEDLEGENFDEDEEEEV